MFDYTHFKKKVQNKVYEKLKQKSKKYFFYKIVSQYNKNIALDNMYFNS